MKDNKTKLLKPFGAGKQVYMVNGVRYIVSSRFQPMKPKAESPTMGERIGKYLESELADLIPTDLSDTIAEECVPTAGKED